MCALRLFGMIPRPCEPLVVRDCNQVEAREGLRQHDFEASVSYFTSSRPVLDLPGSSTYHSVSSTPEDGPPSQMAWQQIITSCVQRE